MNGDDLKPDGLACPPGPWLLPGPPPGPWLLPGPPIDISGPPWGPPIGDDLLVAALTPKACDIIIGLFWGPPPGPPKYMPPGPPSGPCKNKLLTNYSLCSFHWFQSTAHYHSLLRQVWSFFFIRRCCYVPGMTFDPVVAAVVVAAAVVEVASACLVDQAADPWVHP